MNLFAFLSLPKKDMKKILKNTGFSSYYDHQFDSYKVFKSTVGLDDLPSDIKITKWEAYIQKGSIKKITSYVTKNNITFKLCIYVKGALSSIWCNIDDHIHYIYEKESDIYDSRPDCNNLEYYISGDLLNAYLHEICDNNLCMFANNYFTITTEICKIADYVYNILSDGTYEKIIYNLYNIKVNRGNHHTSVLDGYFIYFMNAVTMLYKFNIILNNGKNVYSFEDIAKLYYAYINNLSTDIDWKNIIYKSVFDPTATQYVIENITNELLQTIIYKVDEDTKKPLYAEVLLKAHREYYDGCLEVANNIKKQYNLPEDYDMDIINPYKVNYLQFSNEPIPDHLKNIYR